MSPVGLKTNDECSLEKNFQIKTIGKVLSHRRRGKEKTLNLNLDDDNMTMIS